LDFVYISLELKKALQNLIIFSETFSLKTWFENLIKRILLTMKVYSNPMISKYINQIWAYFCTLQSLHFNDENLRFLFPFVLKLLRKQ
jgi:hypothetical protein